MSDKPKCPKHDTGGGPCYCNKPDELKIVQCADCHIEYAQEHIGQLCPHCVDDRNIKRLNAQLESMEKYVSALAGKLQKAQQEIELLKRAVNKIINRTVMEDIEWETLANIVDTIRLEAREVLTNLNKQKEE